MALVGKQGRCDFPGNFVSHVKLKRDQMMLQISFVKCLILEFRNCANKL